MTGSYGDVEDSPTFEVSERQLLPTRVDLPTFNRFGRMTTALLCSAPGYSSTSASLVITYTCTLLKPPSSFLPT
jgi:hypothetical protein